MRAASPSSGGSERKYWRNRNTKNGAPPSTVGRTSGQYVSTRPSVRKSRKRGSALVCSGSIIAASRDLDQRPEERAGATNFERRAHHCSAVRCIASRRFTPSVMWRHDSVAPVMFLIS